MPSAQHDDFQVVEVIPCRPVDARVYEHGWQSWSPTGIYAGDGTSPRPIYPKAQVTNWRPEMRPPTTGFQGEGLVAIQPGPDAVVTLFAAPEFVHDLPSIRVAARGDSLVVSANGSVDRIADAGPGGIEGALARWGDRVATILALPRPSRAEPMWCSWYCYWTTVTEDLVREQLSLFDAADLDVRVVQLDDGYQNVVGDWLDPRPGFGDVARLAGTINASGRRAGIWTAPFIAGHRSRIFNEHPDWFLHGVDAGLGWDQDLAALDITHPEAARYLDRVFRRFRDIGFSLFKIDYLYAGALLGPRHAPCSPVEAYRRGLELIRDAVGEEATILACGAPLLPSLGLVDVMRVSPDTAPRYLHPSGDASMPSSRNALCAGQARLWQHGRFWINDPDCLIARPEMQERERWAAWIEGSGGLMTSSDAVSSLDDWGLETTRRLLHAARLSQQ